MLVRTTIATLLLLTAVSSAGAQQEFEGVVTYRMTMQGGRGLDMTMFQKGRRTRQESSMGGRAMVQINDLAAGKMYMLMPAQKMYMAMDANALAGMGRGATAPASAKMPKITRTGKTETIAGIRCEQVLMEPVDNPRNMVIDYCVAKGLGVWAVMGGGAGGRGGMDMPGAANDPATRELMKEFKDGFFPLRFAIKENGQLVTSMEALSVEKKSLPEDTFKLPADFTEMKMPGR